VASEIDRFEKYGGQRNCSPTTNPPRTRFWDIQEGSFPDRDSAREKLTSQNFLVILFADIVASIIIRARPSPAASTRFECVTLFAGCCKPQVPQQNRRSTEYIREGGQKKGARRIGVLLHTVLPECETLEGSSSCSGWPQQYVILDR
jgi:hypothetical protein